MTMLIDRTHRKWLIGSLIGLAVATAVYVPYSLRSPAGPKGGSALGLTYGIVGSAFMLFAGLLGARKKFPVWRVGRAQSWMRAHLWLGLLSFPLILFHGGFHFSGTFTRVLMWLFIVVFVSGIFGAALQHFLPRMLTEQLPMETIYEQIDRVRGQLVDEATKLAEEALAALEGDLPMATERQRAAAAGAGSVSGDVTVADGLEASAGLARQLQDFVADELVPFLQHAGGAKLSLADPDRARGMFQQLRVRLPQNLRSTVDDWENICEEKRQLDRQSRFHKLLHGWLLVHIPVSYALLLLGTIHAFVALRY
jgi:hypothetical protein